MTHVLGKANLTFTSRTKKWQIDTYNRRFVSVFHREFHHPGGMQAELTRAWQMQHLEGLIVKYRERYESSAHTSVICIASGWPSSGKRYTVTPRSLRLRLHFLPRRVCNPFVAYDQLISRVTDRFCIARISISCSDVVIIRAALPREWRRRALSERSNSTRFTRSSMNPGGRGRGKDSGVNT